MLNTCCIILYNSWLTTRIYISLEMSRHQEKDEQQQPLTGPDEDSLYDTDSVDAALPLDRRLRRRPSWLYVCLIASVTAVVSTAIGGFVGRQSVNYDKTCAAYTTQYCKCSNLCGT